jgi:hypothetical protein
MHAFNGYETVHDFDSQKNFILRRYCTKYIQLITFIPCVVQIYKQLTNSCVGVLSCNFFPNLCNNWKGAVIWRQLLRHDCSAGSRNTAAGVSLYQNLGLPSTLR